MFESEHVVYVDGTAWNFEMGETDVKVYESAKRLTEEYACTKTCGIAEVRISFVRWVTKPEAFRADLNPAHTRTKSEIAIDQALRAILFAQECISNTLTETEFEKAMKAVPEELKNAFEKLKPK